MKQNNMNLRFSNVLLALLLCALLFWWNFDIVSENVSVNKNFNTIESGWTIDINGEDPTCLGDSPLLNYALPSTSEGDVINLYNTLDNANTNNPMLVFYTWHSVVNIYLNNRCIYTSGQQLADTNQMVGSVRHECMLPDGYVGKNLHIEMITTEDDAMPCIESIGIVDSADPMEIWFGRQFSLMSFGVFLQGLSFVVLMFSFKVIEKGIDAYKLLLLSLAIFFSGQYLLCRSRFMELIFPNTTTYNLIEFLSLYLLPVPLTMFVGVALKKSTHKFVRCTYYVGLSAYTTVLFITLLLNWSNKLHISEMLPWVLTVFVVLLLLLIIDLLIERRQLQKTGWLISYLHGIVALAMGGIVCVILYTQLSNPVANDVYHLYDWYNYFIVVVMFLGLVFFLEGLYKNLAFSRHKALETKTLERLARIDQLCEIGNRHALDLTFEQNKALCNSGGYGVVAMDLNDLKTINDTIGHNTGDRLLSSFAGILKHVCSVSENTTCYRVGGDEFILLVVGSKTTANIIEELYQAVDEFNLQEDAFRISFGLGSATSDDAQTRKEVFGLADKRMYVNKNEVKALRNAK